MKVLNISALVLVSLLFSSCDFNFPMETIEGDGNVTLENRIFTEKIDVVKASNGLEVLLIETQIQEVIVEADQNLQNHIITELKEGVLYVKTDKNIKNAKSKKVTITTIELSGIEASTGATITSVSNMLSQDLYVKATSGAKIDINLFAKTLTAEASSGADISLRGQAKTFNSKASSGSSIDAKDLEGIYCAAKASTGSEITLSAIQTLDAKASTGGNIKYYGEPEIVNQNKSTSGSVTKM